MISYLLRDLPLEQWGLDKKVLLAASIPLVLLTVGFVTHRIKHRLIKHPLAEE